LVAIVNKKTFVRPIFCNILARVKEPRQHIQVLYGPRQVGKTTLVRQISEAVDMPCHYISADQPMLNDTYWLEQQWNKARFLFENLTNDDRERGVLLILDEIQKIDNWSSVVKQCWDNDSFEHRNIKVILLGSSAWLMQHGLTESLAGRFEIIPITHWSFPEMQEAFGISLEHYIYFGGYPGAATFIHDEARWRNYIIDSLIETTISRDILLMTRVDKPALLRKLFELGCHYSAQIVSLQKMMGQLQDKGNVTTLSHYLQLLSTAGMLCGLEKFSGQAVVKKSSSPKLQAFNTALISAIARVGFEELHQHPDQWGRLVESAVGAHLVNSARLTNTSIYYWREGSLEVDFVIESGKKILGIEVKSGMKKPRNGFEGFRKKFSQTKLLLVGQQGIGLETFFTKSAAEWLDM